MDPKQYKKQLQGQLKQLAQRRARAVAFRDSDASEGRRMEALQALGPLERADDTAAALKLAQSSGGSLKLRTAAIKKLGVALSHDPDALKLLLRLLADANEPVAVRSAALSALKVASFHVSTFNAERPAFIAALRKAAQSDDADLRRRSLAALTREKDAPTQKKLIAGLKSGDQSLLPADKALLFLSYDAKLDLSELLHDILRKPPSEAARLQALRMLATDPDAKASFEKLLKNKRESTEARLIALGALHNLEPKKLQKQAIRIVGDDSEDDDVREACMAWVSTFGEDSPALAASASKLLESAGSASARKTARHYLAKRR